MPVNIMSSELLQNIDKIGILYAIYISIYNTIVGYLINIQWPMVFFEIWLKTGATRL